MTKPASLIIHPTDTAQWHALINEAQVACALELAEDLESYLVFLLMRFSGEPQLATSVLALEFLESLQITGSERDHKLQHLGDKCLLFSGLFPDRAIKKRVSKHYFIELGQSAYSHLALNQSIEAGRLFTALSDGFIDCTKILTATRSLSATETQEAANDADMTIVLPQKKQVN